MAHISGVLLIDAPASALNNAGEDTGARTENSTAVKRIIVGQEAYPYVSAQAFRYWLRTTLERNAIGGWQAAPIFREQKVAYTDANPLRYWDDDLLGYMRAPSKKQSAKDARAADTSRAGETPTEEAITRVSPFRVSTLVSIAPVNATRDFGVMSRHDGDPVPYEHQFYRTTLKGIISLDLNAAGTFTYRNKSGYKNLDAVRIEQAKESPGIEDLPAEKAYRLPPDERARRIAALFEGMSRLEGGAKQSIHYTDVAPSLVVVAVLRGGNNPFNHVVAADRRTIRPIIQTSALIETLDVMADQLLSPLYIGWAPGYLDEQRTGVTDALTEANIQYVIDHPRRVLQRLSADIAGDAGREWLA